MNRPTGVSGPDLAADTAAEALALERALEKSHGSPVEVPFDADDVGGQLVQIVSSGLYSDPRDCIREYGQNAFDAGASRIDIRLRGFNVEIEDNGDGMTLPSLLQARKFGMSTKDRDKDIGFRGIGVYAGFPICDRAKIVTQTAKSTISYTLEFDFAWMRNTIEDQASTGSVSLPYLMQHGTRISFERTKQAEHGGTTVHLEQLSSSAYHDLSDWTSLESYIVATLPVAYDSNFKYHHEIEEKLKSSVPGFRSVTVHMENLDSGDSGFLHRQYPIDLDLTKPEFWQISRKSESAEANSEERVVAVAWASWATNRKIKHESAGLLYKVKGFTIGDNEVARRLFKRPALYDWFIGEIWVLDPAIVPNAARSDFENNAARRNLERDLTEQLVKPLDKIATAISKIAVAREKSEEAQNFVSATRAAMSRMNSEEAEEARATAYAELRTVERLKLDLPEIKNIADQRPQLVVDLNSIIGELAPIIAGSRTESTSARNTSRTSSSSDTNRRTTRSKPTKPLAETFSAAGWPIADQTRRALDIVDRALESAVDRAIAEKISTTISDILADNK